MLRQHGLPCPHRIDERPDRNSTNQPGNVPDAAALKSAYGSVRHASRQCGAATGWSRAVRHGAPMLVPIVLAFSQRQWQHRAESFGCPCPSSGTFRDGNRYFQPSSSCVELAVGRITIGLRRRRRMDGSRGAMQQDRRNPAGRCRRAECVFCRRVVRPGLPGSSRQVHPGLRCRLPALRRRVFRQLDTHAAVVSRLGAWLFRPG